jgi:fluoroacetyl-CoA thioesterase
MSTAGLSAGLTGEANLIVEEGHTARALGSGSVAVFATPAMIALMEAAAVDCADRHLPAGCISLGTAIAVEHLAASPTGAAVRARAELVSVDARTLRFEISAHEGGKLIGQGSHVRAIVDRARFLEKLGART